MIPVYLLTNDNHLNLLKGFGYLWDIYCPYPVIVYGFSEPDFELSDHLSFVSLGKQRGKERWSDSLIDMLDSMAHKHFIFMLEDFWLYERVDKQALMMAYRFLKEDVLRVDLSGNRASYKQAQRIGTLSSGMEIVRTKKDTPYQMSFQVAIWNKENMLKVLKRGENPWQAEIDGSKRVPDSLRVLGTNPAVMKYQPVWRANKKKWQLDKIPHHHLEIINSMGGLDGI